MENIDFDNLKLYTGHWIYSPNRPFLSVRKPVYQYYAHLLTNKLRPLFLAGVVCWWRCYGELPGVVFVYGLLPLDQRPFSKSRNDLSKPYKKHVWVNLCPALSFFQHISQTLPSPLSLTFRVGSLGSNRSVELPTEKELSSAYLFK